MSSLRELLDKQKAEKDALAAGTAIHKEIAEKGLTIGETFDPKPAPLVPEPPKRKSVLDRIGGRGINDDPMAAERAIYLAEKTAAMTAIINSPIMHEQNIAAAINVNALAEKVIELSPKQDLPQSSIEELRKNLDFLAENIDQKSGLVGQVVRTIGQQLYENPQFSSCMKDPDFDLLVRGLRRSFNIAARRRVEMGEKKEERREDVLELENMMKDLGVSLKF